MKNCTSTEDLITEDFGKKGDLEKNRYVCPKVKTITIKPHKVLCMSEGTEPVDNYISYDDDDFDQ